MSGETPSFNPEHLRVYPVEVEWSSRVPELTDDGNGNLAAKTGGFVEGEFFNIHLAQNVGPQPLPPEEVVEEVAYANGRIDHYENGIKCLIADNIVVKQDYRRSGIGERLFRSMAYIGVEQGCDLIQACFTNPRSVDMAVKIFGIERISFLRQELFSREWVRKSQSAKSIEYIKDELVRQREAKLAEYASKGVLKNGEKVTDDDLGSGNTEGIYGFIDLQGFSLDETETPHQTGDIPGVE